MTTQTGSISFESAGGLQSYAKQNYATLSQIKGQFATCGTGASTAAKVATIVPTNSNWALYEGATVTVKFTNENTTTAPTLNINGTGAKPIKDYAGNALTSAAYNWFEGTAMALTYDGSSWRIQDSDLIERVHTAETEINQTATSITSLATLEDTYTKPDGTIGTNSIKSQFTQTANAINAKVDKDGVIASINASVEEENGSQIKISADKVNIEGAAIFSSGRLSTTSLNNTYATSSTVNTANATEETLYYASNSTTAPAIPTSAVSTNNASTYGAWNLTLPTYSSSYPYLFTCLQRKSIGNTYSWTKVTQSSYAQWVDSINTTANNAATTAGNAAPKSDAISRTQRIYYRQTAAGAKPGINETWLTTSGTGYGNWSLTVPQLTSGSTKYPKLYTAVQTQTVAQQAAGSVCSCSPVQLDDSTTIIDGGNIITGTISTNSIDASSGTFDTANIPNLSADKITSGYISADRINAGSIGVNKIDATSGTFNTANIPNLSADKITSGDIAADRIQTNLISAINAEVSDISALSATLGGFQVDSNAIHTKNVATTSNEDNSIALSSADFTRTINGTSRAGLRLAIGDKFGVTGDGAIYASSVDLTGKITATSGTIGGCTISNGVLQIADANITGTISGNKINASQITIGESQVTNLTTDLTNAGKTATTYITDIDTNKGITIKPSDSSGNNYLQMSSTDIHFMRNNVDVMNLSDNTFRIGPASSYHTTVKSDGLHVWSGAESTTTNEVASFGSTATVGKTNSSRFLMNADSLQAYNSSNTKYFEVSANGLTWGGSNTAATTTSVSEANNAANTIVTVYPTAIDYAAGTATLAVKCMRGTTAVTPSAYLWTKGTTSTSIGTNSTLSVTDLNAVYNCTVTIAV